MADVETRSGFPRLLCINYVPCFVFLDSQGTPLAKTGVPYSRVHVLKGLSYLLESMRPIRGALKRVPVYRNPFGGISVIQSAKIVTFDRTKL